MFKKIEAWVLYLMILIGILITLAFGTLVRQGIEGKTSLGSVSIKFLTDPIVSLVRIPEKVLLYFLSPNAMQLSNTLWTSPRNFYSEPGFTGEPLKDQALLLLSKFDGDANESIIELIDLRSFEVLHTWNPDITLAHSMTDLTKEEFKYLIRDRSEKRFLAMHPFLNSDGSLILHGNYTPLIRIDLCSDIAWLNQEENFHHSIEIDHEGNYWIPSRMFPTALDKRIVGSDFDNYYDDAITKISSDGEIIFQKSVSEIFIQNQMDYLLFASGDQDEFIVDPIHLNDIEPVLSDGKFWKKGDVFLSLRHQSMIMLYRPQTNQVIWTGTGPFYHQHDIDILNENTISIFNNNAKDFYDGPIVDGYSEVIIYDFNLDQYTQYLQSSLIDKKVKSATEGRSQILDNKDLFIEETNYGRTLYFNSNGSLVWQHVNASTNNTIFRVGWSRILYKDNDINNVDNFLNSKGTCSE